jgi:hypothetical protein
MSGKNIGIQDIVSGALQLGADCVKNKRTMTQQLDWNNGEGHATMDNMIFASNKALFWILRKERARLDANREPCTKAYIDAYNHKAAELGMPEYHVLEES